jgi:hypothetical protein
VAESWSAADLLAAGWSPADLEWEALTAEAMAALAAGDEERARSATGRALFLSRQKLAGGDPRLASAVANHGALLARRGDDAGPLLLSEGRGLWARADQWIARMTAPRVARSSLFHMRMEQRHRATYEERWRVKWAALTEDARARLAEKVPCDQAAAGEALARWRRERPAMLNDTRKLMAAVYLLIGA